MSSKFKYRVWDKDENKYCDYLAITLDGSYLAHSDRFGFYDYWSDPEEPNLIVELCTGFKDEEDKDIYQGDIVSIQRPLFLPGGTIHEVIITLNNNSLLEDFSQAQAAKDGKVIGNVHENPELIRKDSYVF